MSRIALIDPFSGGHHIEYMGNAIAAAKSSGLDVILVVDEKMANFYNDEVSEVIIFSPVFSRFAIVREIEKVLYVRKACKLATDKGVSAIHFLYLDRFIRALCSISMRSGIRYFATCHWAYMLPDFFGGRVGRFFGMLELSVLKLLRKKGWVVYTHSKIASSKIFDGDGVTINYPVRKMAAVPESKVFQFRKSLGVGRCDKLMLCYGGTRLDKGADFAVNVLSKLDRKHHLLIAGVEENISFEFLASEARRFGCSGRLHLKEGFVSDEDTALFFNACDVVFIPYDRSFSGQSGPLTIGASIGKPVVSSDALILTEAVREYGLGEIFEAKSCYDAASKISNLNVNVDADRFNNFHCVARFVEELSLLYGDQ